MLLVHKISSTLQQNLTIKEVVVTGLFQVIHQPRRLYPLVMHCTLCTNGCNDSSQNVLLEHHCKQIKFESFSRIFLSLFQFQKPYDYNKSIIMKSRKYEVFGFLKMKNKVRQEREGRIIINKQMSLGIQ